MSTIKAHFPSKKSFTRLDEFFFERHQHILPKETYPVAPPSAESRFELDDGHDVNYLFNLAIRLEDFQ